MLGVCVCKTNLCWRQYVPIMNSSIFPKLDNQVFGGLPFLEPARTKEDGR